MPRTRPGIMRLDCVPGGFSLIWPGMVCHSQSRSLTCRRFALPVCALLLICGWAASAKATCGDYLAHSPRHETVRDHSSQHHSQTPPAAPCHGPNCGQSPAAPLLPVPQRIIVLPTREATCQVQVSCDVDTGSTWFVASDESLSSSSFCQRLFRPPRNIV